MDVRTHETPPTMERAEDARLRRRRLSAHIRSATLESEVFVSCVADLRRAVARAGLTSTAR